jgi:DNA-binding NarL/FixJ family response regulator
VPERIRVLVVEDSDVYRESLVFLLGRHMELDVVGAVPDGASALRAYEELRPDVVILDYRLPDVDGGHAAADIHSRGPEAAIVFLSASAGQDEYDAAQRAGAALVGKDEGIETLIDAVRAAAGRSET